MIKKHRGELLVLFAAVVWGIGYPVVMMAIQAGVGVYQMTFVRFLLAALVLFPFIRKSVFEASRNTIFNGFILGILMLAGFIFQTMGQEYTTVSNVAFLTGANVIMVPFCAWILSRSPITKRNIIGVFLTFIGIALLTIKGRVGLNRGDIYVLICALFFAFYTAFLGAKVRTEKSYVLIFFQMVFSCIGAGILFYFSNEEFVVNVQGLLPVAYMGILSNLVSGIVFAQGVKDTSATRATIIVSLEVPIGSSLGILLYGDAFYPRMILGGVIMILAIFYVEGVFERKPRAKEN